MEGCKDRQINLLPWRQQRYKRRKQVFIVFFIAFVFLGLPLLRAGGVLLDYQIEKYDLRKKQLLDRLSRRMLVEQKTNQLKQAIVAGESLLKTIAMNRASIRKILDFLTRLRELATPDLFINVLEYEAPFLRLLARLPSKEPCLVLMNSLQRKYGQRLKWDFMKDKKATGNLRCEFQITLEV